MLAGQVVEVGATFKAKANWAVLLYKYMRRIPVEVGREFTETMYENSDYCY